MWDMVSQEEWDIVSKDLRRKALARMLERPDELSRLYFDLLRRCSAEAPENWKDWENWGRSAVYDQLLRFECEAYKESDVPISEVSAEILTRCYPTMPSPFVRDLDPPNVIHFVEHPPHVIQTHFDNPFPALFARAALFSVEGLEQILSEAEESPLHFEALNRAAAMIVNPYFDDLKLKLPTEKHLRLWAYDVLSGDIIRPKREKPGHDPRENMVRDVFFFHVVQDLMACGLPKRRNEAKPGTSACSVVASVFFGKNGDPDTIRKAVDGIKRATR